MTAAPALLLSGVRRQLANDSTPAVREVVRLVLAERPLVRNLDRALQALSDTPIPSWFAALNGARCRVRLRSEGASSGVLACLRRPNEQRAGDWLRGQLGDLPWSNVRFDLRSAPSALSAARESAFHLRRTARFARALGEREDAFQVLRVVELLSYYAKLGELLDEGHHRVAVMSSYSNPWGIALNLAATARGIPVVHVMHGVALDPVPRLNYDAMILNDPCSAEAFSRAGCAVGATIVKSAGIVASAPRAIPASDICVAILLSKEAERNRVHSLVATLLERSDVASIVIRPHPAGLWARIAEELSAYPAGRVHIARATLAEDLRWADVVIAGRSSAHVDALAAGVPTIFDPQIDTSGAAGLSFLSDGTVFVANDDPARLQLESVDTFYHRTEWYDLFRRHANVAESPAQVRERIAKLFASWIPAAAE
jgi:hypothetical protein